MPADARIGLIEGPVARMEQVALSETGARYFEEVLPDGLVVAVAGRRMGRLAAKSGASKNREPL